MTKKLWVTARAFPYNEANDHNETMLPGAFDAGKDIYRKDNCPAIIPLSWWLAGAAAKPKSGYKLPIPMHVMHWDDIPAVGEWTEVRDTPEGFFVYGYVSHPEAIKVVKSGVLPEVSITFVDGEARNERVCGTSADGLNKYEPHTVTAARLVEISLVTGGSFKGCEIHIVKEE